MEMRSSLIGWARLPFHPSPWSQHILGFHPADGKSLWELGVHAPWTEAQLLP